MGSESFKYDIVIVSPNSGIDSYYVLDQFKLMNVNRARRTFHTAGGKGNNMARALVRLGGRALSLGIVGGLSGQFIAQELDREAIDQDLVWTQAESRRLSTLCVADQRDTTVFLESGTPVGIEAQNRLRQCVCRHQTDAPFIVFIGSLPPDVPSNFYADMVIELKENQNNVVIDCAGEALKAAAATGPLIIKVNKREFITAFGHDYQNVDWNEIRKQYEHFCENGLRTLIITDGPRGAFVFSKEKEPFCVKTEVNFYVSTAGAGDTFLAGLLLALGRGEIIQEAACFASAAAATNIQQLGCGFLDKEQIPHFLSKTQIEPID